MVWNLKLLQIKKINCRLVIEMKTRIVFLGTPQIVVQVLQSLKANESELNIQIVAVVAQPPARAARGNGLLPCPVHLAAQELNINVLTPESIKDSQFIENFKQLQPHLCVTAAYGQVLTDEFLAIPKLGTINIHPSLLPLFRGAAPVQRALEVGVQKTGVSLALTVRAMDAGPILKQVEHCPLANIKAPAYLEFLFKLGAKELISILPDYIGGKITAQEQEHSLATKASKIKPEESILNLTLTAAEIHNKVRAFAGWPGTKALWQWDGQQAEVKIVTTSISSSVAPVSCSDALASKTNGMLSFDGENMALKCRCGGTLLIHEVQVPGKRVMAVRDFWNGLKSKSVYWTEV